jgi:DNA-3-methyladenine glycosylase I
MKVAPPPKRAGLFRDDAYLWRCQWCAATPAYRHYHDHEWGFPVTDERRLFEKLCLEGFQAGLSWLTILNARGLPPRLRQPSRPSASPASTRTTWPPSADAGIVRHRGKIESTINNAQRVLNWARVRLARRLCGASSRASRPRRLFTVEGHDDLA